MQKQKYSQFTFLKSHRLVFETTNPTAVEVQKSEQIGEAKPEQLQQLISKAENALSTGNLNESQQKRLEDALKPAKEIGKESTETELKNAAQNLFEALKQLAKETCEKDIADIQMLSQKFINSREIILPLQGPTQVSLASFKMEAEKATTLLDPAALENVKAKYQSAQQMCAKYDLVYTVAADAMQQLLKKQEKVAHMAPLLGIVAPTPLVKETDKLADLTGQLNKTKENFENTSGLKL